MEIREREDINVISIQTQDEEGILYKEYVSTKRRIQFLKEYIESLRMLLERKKAKEIFEDDFRIMAGDCLLVIRRTEEAKYALDEEKGDIRIAFSADSIASIKSALQVGIKSSLKAFTLTAVLCFAPFVLRKALERLTIS